jgi:hypothetical protein
VTTFNRHQWIESFEGQLAILRPHLSERVSAASMSLMAWHTRGSKGEDPITAAQEESKALDAARKRKALRWPSQTPVTLESSAVATVGVDG